MNTPPLQPPQEATDIFSISDQVLADRLQFIEEIGFGNWGSVWLCRPKPDPSSSSALDNSHVPNNAKIAVKLVHRSKTSTTAARVRSLWNEMKVVRALKHEPHPSIIPFYSFIITPSYALITMAHHPRLVPVEVAEQHSKAWFRSLLSGIEFLHKRGVVHNDIKPANILLSTENVPVLVDFGFAERYEVGASDAFHSNLSYGTPEYLSPERARGLPHDTRKSDVWSLGVTFFEILIGRTPFEHSEGEQFSTKEDLEKYWSRTMRGKWVGSWKMSPAIEKMLRKMILPNADLRYTASQAMADPYWSDAAGQTEKVMPSHRKSASLSLARPESANILDGLPGWNGRAIVKDAKKEKTRIPIALDKENDPPSLAREKSRSSSVLGTHRRSQSQSKVPVLESRGVPQTRKQTGMPSLLATLSPMKHSPPSTISSLASALRKSSSGALKDKENVMYGSTAASRTTKKPLGPRKPSPPNSPAVTRNAKENRGPAAAGKDENAAPGVHSRDKKEEKDRNRRSRVFGDATRVNRSTTANESSAVLDKTDSSVIDRMKEWERERQRIREMEKLEEKMREADEERARIRRKRKQLQQEEEEEEMRRRRAEEQRRLEEEAEAQRQREEEEMRVAIERQRLLEIELDRQRDAEVERIQMKEAERRREIEKQRELEEEREEIERQRVREVETYYNMNGQAGSGSSARHVFANLGIGFPPPRITVRRDSCSSTPPGTHPPTPLSPLIEEPSQESRFDDEARSPNESGSGLSILKHGLKKMSIDMTKRFYKSSTLALSRPDSAMSGRDDDQSRRSMSDRASWENDELVREAKSSLPVVRHAVRNEQLAAANQLDRMTIWIKNVEKVVEDARQNFAAASSTTLPPLPVAPVARRSSVEVRSVGDTSANLSASEDKSRRSSRVPRRILAANHIFPQDYVQPDGTLSPVNASFDTKDLDRSVVFRRSFMSDEDEQERRDTVNDTIPTIPSEDASRCQSLAASMAPSVLGGEDTPGTPARSRRRATIVTRSPEAPVKAKPVLEIDTSPSKRREKSKSQNDLSILGRPITPVTKLEFELERLSRPTPMPRLSTLVDKNLFVSESVGFRRPVVDRQRTDELTASPLHVEPYPPRPPPKTSQTMDTPAKKHVEGVYDRFLMSTTGVKRVGKGYQSDALLSNIPRPKAPVSKRNPNFFLTGRRQMPPPVSSEDLRRKSISVDEFGAMSEAGALGATATTGPKGDETGTTGTKGIFRALKAMTVKR